MTLDELLLEWSYRSEKGYPCLDNPSDVSVLKSILKELELPTEDILDKLEPTYANKDAKPGITGLEPSKYEKDIPPTDIEEPFSGEKDEDDELSQKSGGSKGYDDVIKNKLGVDIIPNSKNSYKFESNTFNEQVKSEDLKIWQKLWDAKPPKKTEKDVETAGVGKGELSLYWLYHYSNSGIKADEGRNDDDPDLYFNNAGVEVKAYEGKNNSMIDLGRFGKDRENLAMLNTIFGIAGLAAVFEGNISQQKQISALTFGGKNLEDAFKHVLAFQDIDLDQLGDIYPIFNEIQKKIDFINDKIEYTTAEEGAKSMARKFIGDKLSRKPGWNRHLVNLSKNGLMRFWYIDEEKFKSYNDILGKAIMGAGQGAMKLHFNKIFGK